jgi:hypothetical protein
MFLFTGKTDLPHDIVCSLSTSLSLFTEYKLLL